MENGQGHVDSLYHVSYKALQAFEIIHMSAFIILLLTQIYSWPFLFAHQKCHKTFLPSFRCYVG